MANINTLSDVATYLSCELSRELRENADFSNPEVSQLADAIVEVFSNFEQEVNGYESQQQDEEQ